MAFLEVCGLKKSFGKTEVLKNIDLSLEKGQVLAVIGSSGGGKPRSCAASTSWNLPTRAPFRSAGK